MSATLREVIAHGGFDLDTLEDAEWLLSVQNEAEELFEKAQEMVEAAEQAETDRLEKEYQERFGE